MKRLLVAVGLAVLVLPCLIGCATDDAAKRTISLTYSPGKTDELWYPTGAEMVKSGRLSQALTVNAADGTPLDVWVIHSRDAAGKTAPATGTVVILHQLGYGKGSFPYIGAGERLSKKGYDVVLIDLRAHGRSGGKYITFGAKEKDDVKAVVDPLVAKKSVSDKVYAFGVNLGASVAVQYASVDPRVKGVFAIAPYKDYRSMARLGLPLMNEQDFANVVQAAGKIGEFKPEEASAVEAARKLTCPLLVIHGLLDLSVPLDQSQAVAEAAGGPKKFVVVGPEQLLLPAVYEDWIANQIDNLAKNGLQEAPSATPATQPAKP